MTQQVKQAAGKATPWGSGTAWWIVLVEGIVLLGLGVYLIIWRDTAQKYTGYLVAAYLLLTGVFQLWRGIRMRGKDKMAGTALWRGLVGVVTAGLIFLLPQINLLSLDSASALLGIGLLLYGLMGLYLGFRIKTGAGRPWGSILNSLLVTILGGVFLYGVFGETDIVQIVGGLAALFGVLLIIYSLYRRSRGDDEVVATDSSGTDTAASIPVGVNVYQMRQKMLAIGDDYYIENGHGTRVFKIDGKALRIRKTLIFEDLQGNELCAIKEQMFRIKDSMAIERNGQTVATIKKALITPVRERFTINIENGPDMDIKGNLVDHEYRIELNDQKIAEVSKKWFHVRDTYGVEIAPGQDDIIILAAAVALDQIAHD